MEVIYRNNFDGCACYNTFLDDGFDSGPLFYREDAETGFYHMYQNPMWKTEKPQIILFSDFLNWYEPVDYKATLEWLLLTKEVGVGKPLGFSQTDVRYLVNEITPHRTYLTRIDETTFCQDEIMIAKITALCGHYAIPVNEWYRFRTIRSVFNDLCGEMNVSIYRPADNMKGWSLTDCLAPEFRYPGLEEGAAELLRKYYDKALRYPCRVDAHELAYNMGYTVEGAFLSESSRFRARVLFEESNIRVFNPDKGIMETRTFKEKTILVDPAANHGKNYDFTEDSIIHECNHIFWHQPFQKMQSIHRQHMELAGLSCDLETILHEEGEREELRTIERQARAMTPRVRMPAAQTAMLTQQYQQTNDQRYCNHGRAVEKTISQVAMFFGTSKDATRNRQKEIGNTEVNGVLIFCNGSYLPRHSWSAELRYNESYSIESDVLNALRANNPVLNVILSHELFVYVDGFVCLNHPDYVTFGKRGRNLTTGALKDVSRCCLKFTIHHEHEDNEFTYGVLNNIDKRGMASAELSQSAIDEVLQRAATRYDLPLKIREDFLFTIKKNMEIVGLTEGQLQEMSIIEENRFHKILRGTVKGVTVGEVVAIGLSLGMTPEEIIDLVDKSPAKWENCLYHEIIKVFIHEYYRETVHTFNLALIACNQPPLVDESLAFKRKTRKAKAAAAEPALCAVCS